MATKTASIADIRQILQITGSAELLADADIGDRVDDATLLFSDDRPRILRQEYLGNSEHEFAVPSGWVNDFSTLRRIEWEAGNQTREFLEEDKFEVIRTDTTNRTIDNASSGATSVTISTATEAGYFKDGEVVTVGDASNTETNWVTADGNTTTGVVTVKNALANTYNSTPYIVKQDHILLRSAEPSSNTYFVVEYTGRHTHDDSTDSIPTVDYRAFLHLGASLVAYSIADQMGKHVTTDFDGASTDHLENAEVWRTNGEKHQEIYESYVKRGTDAEVRPYSITRDTDARFSWRRNLLFHGGAGR